MGAEDYLDGRVSASWVKASKSLPRGAQGDRGQWERGKEKFFCYHCCWLAVRDNEGASGIGVLRLRRIMRFALDPTSLRMTGVERKS